MLSFEKGILQFICKPVSVKENRRVRLQRSRKVLLLVIDSVSTSNFDPHTSIRCSISNIWAKQKYTLLGKPSTLLESAHLAFYCLHLAIQNQYILLLVPKGYGAHLFAHLLD